MRRTDLLAGGRDEPDFDRVARRFLDRLPWPAELRPVGRPRGRDESRAAESFARRFMTLLPRDAWIVALDERGELWNSRAFARRLEGWFGRRGGICFVIGDAQGLPPAVCERADAMWSLSPLTFPHALVRVLVAEQLYRAASILAGHPYHRAG
ncbi:MAG: 23S rRNA (pseudouridine(1915)-N(3))-methyltransferase RlmH [Alphaproteobacteria bacterium]|nr:MAG: 23S rRNA (pseudouridine(1915)-N(3))-methyltransferase RlmH [Alphaproteobacteria bacterium]